MDIVEPFLKNYQYLLSLQWVHNVFNLTIQEFNPLNKYEIVFWWHGPEHIDKVFLQPTLEHIEKFTERYIILGCPWGKYEQGVVEGNEFEIHKTFLYENDFIDLGYSVSTLGSKDVKGSHLLAWKKI